MDAPAARAHAYVSPAGVIAACFGLSTFGVAALSGLLNGAEGSAVLGRALAAMIVAYFVGGVIGSISESILDRYLSGQRASLTQEKSTIEKVENSGSAGNPSAQIGQIVS